MPWHICKVVPQSAESLAGRIAYLELTPFTAAEVVKNDTSIADRLWVRGGFPDSFLASSDAASFEWRRALIQTYLEIENLLSQAPPRTTAWFYRSSAGAEIDLLLELAAGHLQAVEIKRSLSDPRPSKGFHLACDDLKVRGRWVVYPGRERYRLDARTEVVPFTEAARPDFRWATESR